MVIQWPLIPVLVLWNSAKKSDWAPWKPVCGPLRSPLKFHMGPKHWASVLSCHGWGQTTVMIVQRTYIIHGCNNMVTELTVHFRCRRTTAYCQWPVLWAHWPQWPASTSHAHKSTNGRWRPLQWWQLPRSTSEEHHDPHWTVATVNWHNSWMSQWYLQLIIPPIQHPPPIPSVSSTAIMLSEFPYISSVLRV